MKGGTLFSGIGAPEQAMPWVDWRWCAEIDRMASAVLATRHPTTRNLGDVTGVNWNEVARKEPVDVIVFGSPCQSFSLAGKRRGMDDPRGNLALVALGIVRTVRPRWFVFENVPGLLSSAKGRDFGAFLGQVEECGYGWAFRVCNALQFGLPQRRRRVFLVGYRSPISHSGDWRAAAAVLFDASCLCRHSPPCRTARSEIAGAIAHGAPPRGRKSPLVLGFSGKDDGGDAADNVCPTFRAGAHQKSHANGGNWPAVAYPLDLRNVGRDRPGMGLGEDGEPAPTCTAGSAAGVAYAFQPRIGRSGRGQPTDVVPALAGAGAGATSDSRPCLIVPSKSAALKTVVRRLTPRECERLQGFPDDYTLVPFRGKPAADGPRYRVLGNSMAVPVMRWIGQRLDMVDRLTDSMVSPLSNQHRTAFAQSPQEAQ